MNKFSFVNHFVQYLNKKATIVLLVFVCSGTINSFACLSASQHRLFPLGQTTKGLCVVETRLNRTEWREKDKRDVSMEPAWAGITYFKIYDAHYKELYVQVMDTIQLFKEKSYDNIVNSAFQKGMTLAQQYPDFEKAQPLSISFCDYSQKCSEAAILFNTAKNQVLIRLPNKKLYDVEYLFDTVSIASNLMNYIGGFDGETITAKSLKKMLYVNSVRQFQIGSKKLSVVHIGRGHTAHLVEGGTYPPGKEYKADFAFSDITKTVFEEPVLHHGQGFDFYIWE